MTIMAGETSIGRLLAAVTATLSGAVKPISGIREGPVAFSILIPSAGVSRGCGRDAVGKTNIGIAGVA